MEIYRLFDFDSNPKIPKMYSMLILLPMPRLGPPASGLECEDWIEWWPMQAACLEKLVTEKWVQKDEGS